MRVLIVTNMWPTAGDPAFGVFVRDQVHALRARGVTIDVHFVDGRARTSAYVAHLPALRRRIGGGGYDLVHAHYVLSAIVAWLARAPHRRPPLIVTHHGIEVLGSWQAPLARWITRRADRTLVVSRPMARRLGLPDSAVIPMGVDLTRFSPGSRASARRELGLDPDAVRVAWVGSDRPEKRLSLARAAVERLRADVPGAALLEVVGHAHDRVPTYLRAADVLLLTSSGEGAPVVVKEALACNRPVVSTDVGDVRDVIAGVDGCAIVDATPEALAAGLRRALRRPEPDAAEAVAPYDARRIAARVHVVYAETVEPCAESAPIAR